MSSRKRVSFQIIDDLTESLFLEPSQQDELITLLNSESYSQNQQIIKIFVSAFLLFSPIYLVLPYFRKSHPILGFLCLLTVSLNCLSVYFLNPFYLRKKIYALREFGESSELWSKLELSNTLIHALHLLLAMCIVMTYYKEHTWEINGLYVFVPLVASITSIVLSYWAKELLDSIEGLKGLRYKKEI